MNNQFLSMISGLLPVIVQLGRANPKFPEWVAWLLLVVIGIGMYALGADTVELASREWWQGAVVYVLLAAGITQGTSSLANQFGIKSLQTNNGEVGK